MMEEVGFDYKLIPQRSDHFPVTFPRCAFDKYSSVTVELLNLFVSIKFQIISMSNFTFVTDRY